MLKLMRAPHKYVQGDGALKDFYDQTSYLGKRFLLICSNSGKKNCEDLIVESCKGQDVYLRFETFAGISSNGEIERMKHIVVEDDIDVVVGVGGGSAVDTAKATAYYSNKSIVIIPTIAATDAPCTGLSVIYNDDHSFDRYIFYPSNPDIVLVDSRIIANSPTKFLVAGMGDALATYFEARTCFKTGSPSLENGGITLSGLALCKECYNILLEYGVMAKEAADANLVTPALEAVIEATTYLSGVGADNGGLAAAHSIYNGFTGIEECKNINHGDLVAFGVLVQLVLENAEQCEFVEVLDFMESVGLPTTLSSLGIVLNDEQLLRACKGACAEGETIHHLVGEITPEMLKDAVLAADRIGSNY